VTGGWAVPTNAPYAKAGAMQGKSFSYELEKQYYTASLPAEAKPYDHLEPYFRSWLNPETVFRGKRILDIGAGECTYSRLIADRFEPAEIVACELFAERMWPASRANGNAALKFIAGDCRRLPFRNGCFDVVFGSLVLHQLPCLDKVICEVRRVLSDTGCYVGIEPNPYHFVQLYRYFRKRHSPNQYLLTARDLRAFGALGFEVDIKYFYAKIPWMRNRFLGTCMGIMANL
jgi:SAM-dependent methyltransferase